MPHTRRFVAIGHRGVSGFACASALMVAGTAAMAAAPAKPPVWQSDQGDGTYRNPVLYADYPDPDIIRVGHDFYLVSTTFVDVPGITILHSKDLINWTIAAHVAARLDGSPRYDLKDGGAYREGFFAASIRHRGGMFYIVVTPVGQNTRIYYAPTVKGPWHYHTLDRVAFDPGLFIDDDDKAYIVTSSSSDGTITLFSLDRTLSHITNARRIGYIKGAEGSKVIKRDGWYYLFNSVPAHLGMTVSRSRSLTGPWETRDAIDDHTGGHQGALVDLPGGGWFGFVMRDSGAIGRMTNMSPVFWKDGWPIWGTPAAPGRVPDHAAKPIKGFPVVVPPASDDFSSAKLGLQWQWNHNPVDRLWSLSARPGYLRLRPSIANGIWSARNTLVQKAQGPRGVATIKLDISHVAAGDQCGFGTLGQFSAQAIVSRDATGHPTLRTALTKDTIKGPRTTDDAPAHELASNTLWLREALDFAVDRGRFSFSDDGRHWTAIGTPFPLAFAWRTGTFQGEQLALFCYASKQSVGYLDVDSFTLTKP